MWRASFSIPSVSSLSLWKKNCLSAPSTPPLFLLYTDITARTPQKSAHDVSSHFLVGRKKHNTSLAHEYCVPWQYIGFLMMDEIRLLYLFVPLRKVPRRNRTLASSTDVQKLSLKHGIHAPKVHFSSTSATQPKFSGRPPKWQWFCEISLYLWHSLPKPKSLLKISNASMEYIAALRSCLWSLQESHQRRCLVGIGNISWTLCSHLELVHVVWSSKR